MAMKIKLMHLLAGIALLAAGEVHATPEPCKTITTVTMLSVPELAIQRDLPVGAEIGAPIQSGIVSAYDCPRAPVTATRQYAGVRAYGSHVMDIDGKRVYETGIPGIGYAVGVEYVGSMNFCGVRWVGQHPQSVAGYPDGLLLCYKAGGYPAIIMKGKLLVSFYKTAKVIGSGEISNKQVGAFISRIDDLWNPGWKAWAYPESIVRISSIKANTLSCSLTAPSINVDMDKVGSHLFGGVGTWPGDNNTKPFSIPLSCAAGAKVNLKIDGNVQNASQGVLKLDAGKNSATGVGIQLLYDEKPVELGKTFKVGTASSKGEFNIPLKARYLQTEPTLTPGEANGSATITLTYQ
ncbi:Fimbrial protein [compost metagenome]